MLDAWASFSASVIASLCVPFFFLQANATNLAFGNSPFVEYVDFHWQHFLTSGGQVSECSGPQGPDLHSQQPTDRDIMKKQKANREWFQ